MQTFRCACGARLFFKNYRCLSCDRELGFVPSASLLSALEPEGELMRALALPGALYKKCLNYSAEGVCNWMVGADEPTPYCQACRLNGVIPDLTNPENRTRWAEMEGAKRQLVYSLNRLGLPVVPKSVDEARGVSFDIVETTPDRHVITGHMDGLITLDIAEADPVVRERVRVAMNESYRTVLGHFRHEIGHYYWDLLVDGTEQLDAFRERFGDERADYGEALRRYYEATPPPDWSDAYVSVYATSHPWEDWAESFAHYLHIADTLDTARHFGLNTGEPSRVPVDVADYDALLLEWMDLTVALNALNRSMGQKDAYPFALSEKARAKLAFVHRCVERGRTDAMRSNTASFSAPPSP